MTARQARERQLIVAFLLAHDPTCDDRAFMPPKAPVHAVALSEVQAKHRLRTIARTLDDIGHPGEYGVGPVWAAWEAVQAKAFSRPADLIGSAKLYRAICDLELAASLPAYAGRLEVIEAVIDELRRLSGWRVND